MEAMRKTTALLLLSTFALAGLSSCTGKEGSYYRIDIYSDYLGMEADMSSNGHYSTSNPGTIHVGFCYALPGKEAKTGGIQSLKYGDKVYNYREATRTAPTGYHYEFKSLVGHYNNDPSKPVDLNKITANCAVFATFEVKPNRYLMSVKDAFGDMIYSGFSTFNTTVGDEANKDLKAALSDFPAHDRHADPEDPKTWRDPYYKTYTPKEWTVTIANDDGTTSSTTLAMDAASISAFPVSAKTTFEPAYTETTNNYTVTIDKYQKKVPIVDLEGHTTYEYHDFTPSAEAPTSLTVPYLTNLEEYEVESVKPLAFPGLKLVGEGNNGVRSRFASSPTLPTALINHVTNEPITVDIHAIRYDCHVTLIYEDVIPTYTVTFQNTDPAVVHTVSKGDGVHAPASNLVTVPAGKSYTGLWSADGNLPAVDLSNITSDLTLLPITTDTVLEYAKDTSSPTMTYTFNYEKGCYALTGIAPAVAGPFVVTTDLFPTEDFFPAAFTYKGVEGLGTGASDITSIVFPEGTSYVDHGVLTHLNNATLVDLTNATISTLQASSFQNLPNLETVRLPGTIETIGENVFRNCTRIANIYLDMTEAAYNEIKDTFPTNWNAGATLTFKA